MIRPGSYRFVPFITHTGEVLWQIQKRTLGIYMSVRHPEWIMRHQDYPTAYYSPEICKMVIYRWMWRKALKQVDGIRCRRVNRRIKLPPVVVFP